MKPTCALIAAGSLVFGACASANTPQQDLAYARWAGCNLPYAQLERVDLDGRITFLASSSATQEAVLRCLTDAGRGGPRLPDPVAARPTGGP